MDKDVDAREVQTDPEEGCIPLELRKRDPFALPYGFGHRDYEPEPTENQR